MLLPQIQIVTLLFLILSSSCISIAGKPHRLAKQGFLIPNAMKNVALRASCNCDSMSILQSITLNGTTNDINDLVTVTCRNKPESGVIVFIKWADNPEIIKAYVTNGFGQFQTAEPYNKSLSGEKIIVEWIAANGKICTPVSVKYP